MRAHSNKTRCKDKENTSGVLLVIIMMVNTKITIVTEKAPISSVQKTISKASGKMVE